MSTAWIFDFDGVLVNTMETHFACYRQALAEAGISVNADEIHRRKGEIFREHKPEAKKIDCMVELLHLLRGAGYRIAIASGSSRPSVQPVIDQFDLSPDALVTSEDVQHGKPHPDLFLLAAQKLGVLPELCMVVEDSDVGIESARRAGMRALRFFDRA